MLDRHADLAILPETSFYDEIAPHLSRRNENFRQLLGDWHRLPELGLEVDSVLKRSGTNPTPARLFTALLELYAQKGSKPRVGEKTPTHLKHVSSIINDFPRADIICLVRDGRDVALSLRSMSWFTGNLADAAQEWLKAAHLLHHFKRTYPRRFLVVHYEQLITAPEETLRSIMTFAGLEFQPAQLSPDTPSGVVMPRSLAWKGQALTAVDKTLASSRRSAADPAEIRFLNDTLGVELLRLNYSLA